MIKVSAARRRHILDGDATGGGHGPGRGLSGKSEFPATLTDDQIIAGVEALANDPTNYPGGTIPTAPGRFKISGVIGGVKSTVIVDPKAGEVITAWPEGDPATPNVRRQRWARMPRTGMRSEGFSGRRGIACRRGAVLRSPPPCRWVSLRGP